jgi:hypothetical protein
MVQWSTSMNPVLKYRIPLNKGVDHFKGCRLSVAIPNHVLSFTLNQFLISSFIILI